MARTAEGWRLKWKPSRGGPIAHVRFTWNKRREEITTGSRDPVEAPKIAARIYADFISGRLRRMATKALVHPATALDEIGADWIDAIANEIGDGTDETYGHYVNHWTRAMPTIGNVDSAGIGSYQRARLGHVQRVTVIKERSALLRFLTWCVERGILAEVPAFPKLPKKATGKRHKQGRRKPQRVLEPDEVHAILAQLTPRTGPFYIAMYETGLPPSTLARLVPDDLTAFGLHIRPENDKNQWERTVPITARARAALTRLPFSKKDRRAGLQRAVKLALGEGRKVTPYDMKHAMVTHKINAGAPILGLSYATGRSAKTLFEQYAHPTRSAAEQAIWGQSGAEKNPGFGESSCEGRDLNPDGSYPASTSSKLHAKQTRLLSRERYRKVAEFHKASAGTGAGPQLRIPRATVVRLVRRSA